MIISHDILSGAYSGDQRLDGEVRISGARTIGDGAFCGCSNLKMLSLDSRVKMIGADAFAKCPQLCKVVFQIPKGEAPEIQVGNGAFADCGVESTDVKQLLSGDVAALIDRGAVSRTDESSEEELRRAVSMLFSESLVHDGSYMREWTAGFKHDSDKFREVSDWLKVSDAVVDYFIASTSNGVAGTNRGGLDFQQVEWNDEKRVRCRQIAEKLRLRCQSAAGEIELADLREEFFDVMGRNLWVIFYRMVASLRPDKFVPVVNIPDLEAGVVWLKSKGFIPKTHTDCRKDWAPLSALFLDVLRKFLPGKNEYELGVFAWCIAKAHVGIHRQAVRKFGLFAPKTTYTLVDSSGESR